MFYDELMQQSAQFVSKRETLWYKVILWDITGQGLLVSMQTSVDMTATQQMDGFYITLTLVFSSHSVDSVSTFF